MALFFSASPTPQTLKLSYTSTPLQFGRKFTFYSATFIWQQSPFADES